MQDNQTVNGHWVYGAIVIPIKEIYIGMSGKKYTSQRWQPSLYKGITLQPYIQQYGWENIHFFVFKDGLTKKQAEQLEDLLITQAKLDNWCINKQGSGGKRRDNPAEYYKQYQDNHREEIKEVKKQYYNNHKEEKKQYDKQHYQERKDKIRECQKQYYQTHKEEKKQYDKQYNKQRNSTPAGKIYNRVKNHNRYHPDQIVETPLEARQKYLETGYIPNYIKNNDLK